MSLFNKINIAVIGATGYTGLDLINILSRHPKVKIMNLCATKNIGKKISFFDKRIKANLPKITNIKKIDWKNLDLVFLSLPNGEAQKIVRKTFHKYKNLKYIDLSADFRISSHKDYYKNYKIKHLAKNLIKQTLYSISEFNRDKIKNFRIIANPGCYPTSVQIPLIPLIKNKLISHKNIIIDSKSGYSGAGKNLKKKFTHKNIFDSTYAYNLQNHRHVCEIEQELKKFSRNIEFIFTPHLLPTFRGILSTIYVETKNKNSAAKLKKILDKYYKNSKFIKVHKLNTELGSGNVINTNNCEISINETKFKNKIIILSAIDNLLKGASGQAVQNMNLLFNFPEKTALK